MLKMLVVEDNIKYRQMLVKVLKEEFPDIEILEAGEGEEALRVVNELRPFLVSMDISLPGENGLDLTRKIKTGHPEMQVVILTSHDFPEYRDAARRCGANRFMAKGSVSFQEILQVVRSILIERTGRNSMVGGDNNLLPPRAAE
jgi:DNA-binding NarL/FixJ family response regulator